MAKTKRVRWECPNGNHSSVLGPMRPRKDSIVRYCLDCSQATGRLVERTAPVLEKMRAAKTSSRQERTQQRRERVQAKAQQYPNVLNSIFKRVQQLPCWKTEVKHATLTLRHSKTRLYTTGRANWGGRVVVTAGREVGEAIEVVVHELAHVAYFSRHGTRTNGVRKSHKELHDYRFHAMLTEATRELLGDKYLEGGVQPAKSTKYALDRVLVPIYKQAVEDGVFGELPVVVEAPQLKRRQPELPLGQVRFNIPESVWATCFYDDVHNPESFSEAAWKALEGHTSRRTGAGRTYVVTAPIELATEIAKDIDSHNDEDWRVCDQCAAKIREQVYAAQALVAHAVYKLFAALKALATKETI